MNADRKEEIPARNHQLPQRRTGREGLGVISVMKDGRF